MCVSVFIILQKNKRSKEEHSFDPYTLNTDKKRLKYVFYLTGFNININPTICRAGRCTRHQADGSGTFIGEGFLLVSDLGQGKVSLDHTGGHLLHFRIRLNVYELGSSFCYCCVFLQVKVKVEKIDICKTGGKLEKAKKNKESQGA